jgi:hypothetical protein
MHDDSQLHTTKLRIMMIYNIKPKNSFNTFCHIDCITQNGKHWNVN